MKKKTRKQISLATLCTSYFNHEFHFSGQNFSLLSSKTCNYNRILPENLMEKLPWPSPQHAQDSLGCSSAVTEEGERVPEAGAAGGVCCSAPGQHAAHGGGYIWGSWCWGLIRSGPQGVACAGLELCSEWTGDFPFVLEDPKITRDWRKQQKMQSETFKPLLKDPRGSKRRRFREHLTKSKRLT